MNEREFHDHHYGAEAGRIFSSPMFRCVHDRSAREFLRATRIGRRQRLLSLGCGDGAIERRLAPYVGEVVALDISGVAIAQARAAAAAVPNLSFVECDPRARALESWGRFDAIAAFAFLHHLDDAAIAELLTGARRALAAGGVFCSVDPSRRRLVRRFAGLVRGAYERHHSPEERELDPEALVAAAARAGFRRTALGYADFFLGPLAWLAPGTPAPLVEPLAALDDLALRLPLVRRYASSFRLLAWAE